MPGNNVPYINVRELGVRSTARAEQRLDGALGLPSTFAVQCERCRGDVEFDTDHLGRSIERCLACGYVKYLAAVVPRPVGERYNATHKGPSPARREPRRSPDTTDDADVQLLRSARLDRADAPMNPALLAAKREFDAMEAAMRAARKGGRPPNNFNVGGKGRPKRGGPIVILDDDTPAPLLPSPTPSSSPAMTTVESPRVATRCGHAVSSRKGPVPKDCPDCKRSGRKPVAPTQKPTSAKKKARRIATGFKRQSAPATATGGLTALIGGLEAELAGLDARRKKLVAALEHLQEVAAA